jgi:hypothetical protein
VPLPSRFLITGAAVAVLGSGGLGCTSPQTGLVAATWCLPTAAQGMPLVMLDDMEDGDDRPCVSAAGPWSVGVTGGDVTPAPGTKVEPQELVGELAVTRTPASFRALHLSGTLAAGGHAELIMPLADPDLNPYKEIDFWARSDHPEELTLRVSVVTPAGADGDYFGDNASMIRDAWGIGGSANFISIGALYKADRTTRATPDELAASTAIIFQLVATGATAFGFWIDDVQLKRIN